MHRRCVYTLLILCAWLLAGCEGAAVATPAPHTITIGGATAMQPLLHALTTEFQRQHPSVLFDLRAGGSTLGEERLLRGELDMAATTLLPPAAPGEPDLLTRTPIGLDGIAIVVHPTNRLDTLTALQLRDLFSGHLLDWAEVGSAPGEIVLVSREDGSASRHLFEERIMGDERVALTAVVMPSSADVVDFVSTHPQAIGYVSAGYTVEALRGSMEAAVHVVRLEGELPIAETLLAQRYLLIQPLYLATAGEPAGWIRQFIDFALAPSGQEIVSRYHAPIR